MSMSFGCTSGRVNAVCKNNYNNDNDNNSDNYINDDNNNVNSK